MMTPEIAKAAMQFLLRVQLQGQEVPAFNVVMNALEKIVTSEKKGGQKQPKETSSQKMQHENLQDLPHKK